MHTAPRHAAPPPAVSSRQIGDRLRARSTVIAIAIIAIIGMPGITPFASPAFAQSNAASAARVADPFTAYVGEASERFGIPMSWIRAVVHAESGEHIHALSPEGAMGLMQIMPATWANLRARHGPGVDPFHPHDNILAGAALLRELYDQYGSPGFLAAYNAGPGRYEDHLATGRPIPDETRAYVATIAALIGERRIDGTIAVASVAPSWTEGPIFVGQDEAPPQVDNASASVRPNRSPGSHRIADISALVPPSSVSDRVFLCAFADCIVGLTMERGGKSNTTKRRLDKSGSPDVIQALNRACLFPCRAVGSRAAPSPRISGSGEDFRVRPGRIRSTRPGKSKSFVNQVLRAAKRAGHTAPRSGPGKPTGLGRSTFGRGRLAFSRNRLFAATRRVVVKARVSRHAGRAFRSAPVSAHVAYLKQEGVTRDGEKAPMFDAETDRADDAGFADRTKDDRHHFRFIVSPEDAAEMTDLRAFTRDLARQMEADLGTRLDWITGKDLVISRDYISPGLRFRAEELVSIELGPEPEHEIRSALEEALDRLYARMRG
eukprot:gene1384-1406_t